MSMREVRTVVGFGGVRDSGGRPVLFCGRNRNALGPGIREFNTETRRLE